MPNSTFTFYLDNIIERGFCTVEGIREPFVPNLYATSSMPGSRLKNQEPTEVARILTLSPSSCAWSFLFYNLPLPIDAVGIVNTSLSRYGKWRVIGRYDAGPLLNDLFADYSPTAIQAGTNYTGLVTNIDEPIHTPDITDTIRPTFDLDPWNVRLLFPITGPAVTGPSSYIVVLFMKLLDLGGPSELFEVLEYPRVDVEIWEDGVFKLDLGYKAVTSMDGQYILFDFDGAILTDKTKLEVKISSARGSHYLGASTLHSRLVTAAVCVANGVPQFDTGWKTNSAKEWTKETDIQTIGTTIGEVLDSTWTASWLALFYMDDGLELNPLDRLGGDSLGFVGIPFGLISQLPNDYIDTGVFVASEALRLTYGVPVSRDLTTLAPISIESQQTGLQGESYSADSYKIKEGESVELLVTHSEGLTLLHRIGLARGTQGAFLVSIDPNLPDQFQPFLTEWVTCGKMSGLKRFPQRYNPDNAAEMLYLITVQFRQRL